MKTISNPMKIVLGIFAIGFILTLAFVSLMGELNKVDTSVENFLSAIREQKYYPKDPMIQIANHDVFDTEGNFSQNCFLLELSLLEYYGLTNEPEYKIHIKRSSFWIPFLQKPSINVQVSLKRPASVSDKIKWPEPINDLFTVNLQNGAWKITKINLKNSPLFEKYKSLKPGTDPETFMSQNGNEVTIKLKFNLENLTEVEKRKIQFILNSIGQLLN